MAKLITYSHIYVVPPPFKTTYAVGIVEDENGLRHPVRIDNEFFSILRSDMEGDLVKKQTDFGEMEFFTPKVEKKEIEKVALVTGATRGIGKAIAIELAKKGFNIVINDVELPDEGKQALEEIEKLGRKALFIKADISKYEEVDAMIKEVEEKIGRIFALINNAGINIDKLLTNMTPAMWQKVIDIDLTGVYNCTRAVIPYMIEQGGGRIINMSSQAAFDGPIAQANYAAAKGGIVSFTRVISREYAQYNILCNAIAPGCVKTRMTDAIPLGALKERIANIPLGRRANPEEVAAVVAFLVTEGTYVTGQTIKVNAGEYF
jgi:3-oxoacyl-[acyl-carrier protein] reductase